MRLLTTSLLSLLALFLSANAEAQSPKGGFFEDNIANDFFSSDSKTKPTTAEKPEPIVNAPDSPAPSYDPKNKTEVLRQSMDVINRVKDASRGVIRVPDETPGVDVIKNSRIKQDSQGNIHVDISSKDGNNSPPKKKDADELRQKIAGMNSGFEDKTKTPLSAFTLNVYASDYPSSHLAKTIREARQLLKNNNVRTDSITVVPSNHPSTKREPFYKDKQIIGETEHWPQNYGLVLGAADKVPDKFRAKTSPVWILTFRGQTHVFEGNYNMSELFNRDGEVADEAILGGDKASPLVIHPDKYSTISIVPRDTYEERIDYEEREKEGLRLQKELRRKHRIKD